MRRTEMIELHDHPRFPAFLRDMVTDALQALWQFGNSYGSILPRLYRSLTANSAIRAVEPTEIIDLCSGGGGPWVRLARELERDYRLPVHVSLTDKYPHNGTFEPAGLATGDQTAKRTQLDFIHESVDAMRVPAGLRGFRTMFSSFHHFGPTDARGLLRNAVEGNRGIGIFELAHRRPKTLLVLCLAPLLLFLLTPQIRPFRWSRLFWTYLVPVVPFVIWFDGLVSCLRAYSAEELHEMVQEMTQVSSPPNYCWQLGEEHEGLLPVTYLIGYPVGARPVGAE